MAVVNLQGREATSWSAAVGVNVLRIEAMSQHNLTGTDLIDARTKWTERHTYSQSVRQTDITLVVKVSRKRGRADLDM